MPLSAPVASLLDQFHASKPVRAWSLIVTVYGDAIVPRGGSLWLGSLIEIMALFRIDSGHVRTAMSRLTSEGWLKRERIGRNSYYRLSQRGEGAFKAATQRIYFSDAPPFDGRLRLVLIGADRAGRPALRGLLGRSGFAALSSAIYVGLSDAPASVHRLDHVFPLETQAGQSAQAIAAAAWKLAPLADSYRAFIKRFAPFEKALARRTPPDLGDALVARTLLIHAFRRIVLRDPSLPAALLPGDWPGNEARLLAGRIYRRLLPASETWLDRHAENESGPLPPTQPSLTERFSH